MAGADDTSSSLGAWLPADLANTARADAGVGTDDGAPPIRRFVSNVVKLIRRRRAQSTTSEDPSRPAAFLLHPNPADLNSSIAVGKRVPMLDNGMTRVTGRIWFVSAVVVSGRYVECDETDDEALFRVVTDTLGLGATPAIIFDPRPQIAETLIVLSRAQTPAASASR